MPKWDYCGQSNLLGSEGKEEDGEDIAYCKTARVLNKHLLRRPINARSRARHGEEGWRYEPRFVSKSQWYLRVEIWACQLGRKSQERRKGERERWGRGRREKGWSRILKEIWRSELPGSNGKDAVWMPARSGAEFVWSKLCMHLIKTMPLDGITDSMDMSLSKFRDLVVDRKVWHCYSPWGHKELNRNELLNWCIWPALPCELCTARQRHGKLVRGGWPRLCPAGHPCVHGTEPGRAQGMCAKSLQSCPTLWTVARQMPLSLGFSRQEHESGLSCPCSGCLPDPGIEPGSLRSPALAGGFFTTSTSWEAEEHHFLIQLKGD